MSMEARVEQFHTDAMKPRDAKTPKAIQKLRSFLYKNQEHRFTDREQSHLFQAVQLYVTMYGDAEDCPALPLLDDALKMPFTVFTTSQKKTMLRWLSKLTGASQQSHDDGDGDGTAVAPDASTSYALIDLSDATAELMDYEGNTLELQLAGCDARHVAAMQEGFRAEKEVRVRLAAGSTTDNGSSICSIRVL